MGNRVVQRSLVFGGVTTLLAFLFWAIGCAPAGSSQQPPSASVDVAIVNERAGEDATQMELLGTVVLAHGWHTYWINPGDAGMPPRLAWSGPGEVREQATWFEIPQRILEGDLTTLGYYDTLRFTTTLTVAGGEALPLHLRLTLLLCKEECVPVVCSTTVRSGAPRGIPAQTAARLTSLLPQQQHALGTRVQVTDAHVVFTVTGVDAEGEAWDLFPIDAGAYNLKVQPQVTARGDTLELRLERGVPALALGPLVSGVLVRGGGGERRGYYLAARL